MDWQTATVLLIELAAIAFLVQRLALGRRATPSPQKQKPDVRTDALLKKSRR